MDMSLKPVTAGRRRSVAVAYVLCVLFGLFGAHRLYLGHGMSAAAMAAITLVSIPLIGSGLGLLGFVATGTWMLSDLVLIPSMTREAREGTGAIFA